MIPKIKFRYSAVHDAMFKLHLETFYKAYNFPKTKEVLEKYPSKKRIDNYISKIEPLWIKYEQNVLQEISKITALKWQENLIKVYLVGYCRSYSDPVTIRLFKDKTEFIEVLVHELIHQIQSQNSKIFKKWLLYIGKKYKNEAPKTKSHILVHAVHYKIYLSLFNERRLRRNIKKSIKEDYRRAWQIVEKEGAENIIKKFKEVTK